MSTYKVWRTKNSPFLLTIRDILGNVYTNAMMATISRIYVKYISATGENPKYADSNDPEHAAAFDWVTFAATGRLLMDLGVLDFTAGRDANAEVVVFDTDYPEGRVVEQLDIYVSDEVEGDIDLVDPISFVSSGFSLTVTDDYEITTANLGGTVRLNAATDKTLILPSVGADEDGKAIILMRIGAGNLTALASDSDTIGSSTATQVKSGSALASITLQYTHSITAWVVLNGRGSWSAS